MMQACKALFLLSYCTVRVTGFHLGIVNYMYESVDNFHGVDPAECLFRIEFVRQCATQETRSPPVARSQPGARILSCVCT
jgi:hypothetical protein